MNLENETQDHKPDQPVMNAPEMARAYASEIYIDEKKDRQT